MTKPPSITYDQLLKEKLGNCGKWLQTLEPVKKHPEFAQLFLSFTEEDRELNFKKWYLDNVKPNIANCGLRAIGHRLIVQNGFLVTDFQDADLKKFLNYLSCFCSLCRSMEEMDADKAQLDQKLKEDVKWIH